MLIMHPAVVHSFVYNSGLLQSGPKFGYFSNPSKSSLVVYPNIKCIAEQMFGSLGVKIVCDHRFFYLFSFTTPYIH